MAIYKYHRSYIILLGSFPMGRHHKRMHESASQLGLSKSMTESKLLFTNF